MNTKQILYALGVLVVVGALAVGFSFFGKAPESPAEANTSPVLKGSLTPAGDFHYFEDSNYYTIDVTYPAKLSVEQALADDITRFKTDGNFANLTPEDIQIQGLGPDRKYAYAAKYETHQSSSTMSYVFTIYQDTLGAHPNGFYRTFTFDLQGNELALSDLFKPGAAYLPALSAESYKQVVAQLTQKAGSSPTPEMLDEVRIGTSPSPETLQFFYLDGDTLGLLFPPYQVAAYAAGSFEVKIPRSQLQSILR